MIQMIIRFTMKKMHGHTKFGFRRCRCHGNDDAYMVLNHESMKWCTNNQSNSGQHVVSPPCVNEDPIFRDSFSSFWLGKIPVSTVHPFQAMDLQAHEGCQTRRRLSPDGLANCLHTSCTSAMACFMGLPWRGVKRSLRSPRKGPTSTSLVNG